MANDFLVEIGTEELPPKALKTLAQSFHSGICDGLTQKQLSFSGSQWFATPRRLAVVIKNLKEKAPDSSFEIHGPPVTAAKDKNGNWTKAAIGFAKKNACMPEDLKVVETDKGERLAKVGIAKGYSAIDSLEFVVKESLILLPIPKPMRWGANRAEFIRPVHWAVMLYGDQVIPAEILGVPSGNQSRGHRFHADTDLPLTAPADYPSMLEKQGHIVADYARRRQMIQEQVTAEAKKLGGTAVIDEDLLDEVTSLVEWPVALAGAFDKAFLSVPAEALVSSMKEHQKYFHLVGKNGKLLPHFITVANIVSQDPQQVIHGNERVIRPRLADAAFFFETDKQQTLDSRVDKLKSVVFQQKLGTLYDKCQRIQSLAGYIAGQIDADAALAQRAGLLSKADLVSDMVLEFDTMQGIAGSYYAEHDGEPAAVCQALAQQYLPRYAGDALPGDATGIAVALADRLDTLIGIFGINQPPTGSRDPFALRRASLGVLRIIVEKQLPLDLQPLLEKAASLHKALPNTQVVEDVLAYMIERFRAWYEEEQIPVQVFQAVSARRVTAPLDFNQRVKAVYAFHQLPEAEALAAANKRVSNILAKADADISSVVDSNLLQEPAEQQLASEVDTLVSRVQPLFEQGQYTEGLTRLAGLRDAVDNFFEQVMVMTEDEAVRNNRLALLARLQGLFLQVADISLLASAR